jgi:PAS domain S-box-containing protein
MRHQGGAVPVSNEFDPSSPGAPPASPARPAARRQPGYLDVEAQVRQLQLLMEHAPAMIAMLDCEMRYLACSRRWVVDLGITDPDIIGHSHYELFSDIPERWKEVHRRCLAGAVETCELDEYPRSDGTVDWLRWEVRPWRDASDEIGGLIMMGEVITGRVQTERALRESERRHRALIENLPGAVCRYRNDADWTVEYMSPAIERLTGYPAEAFLSGAIVPRSLVHPADREAARTTVQDGLARCGRFALECRVRHADGSERWLAEHGSGVYDEAGELQALEGFLLDVTDRKHAEAAEAEGRLRLEAIVRAAGVGLWDWDIATNRVYFSPDWKRQLGYEDHEIADDFAEWQSRVHPDDLPAALANIRRYLAEPGPLYQNETRMRHRDGTWRWILVAAALLRDADGQPLRMLGAHIDVTERKQAAEAMRESERYYRELFEQSTDGILVADARGPLVGANPAACRMLGCTHEQLLGMTLQDVIVPSQHARIAPEIVRLLEDQDVRTEWRCRRHDGSEFEVEVVARRRPDGLLQGFLRDVTERNLARGRLAQALTRAQALNRRLVETQEAEQRRLSAELHDRIGQNLTALHIDLKLLGRALPPPLAEKLAARLSGSQALLDATIASVRNLITELRPAVLEDYGLLAGLRAYGREFEQRSGIVTEVTGEDPVPRLAPPVELALYRIAQETLTNAYKHARASRVGVGLAVTAGGVELCIADDGDGFDPQAAATGPRTHWGLVMVRERAEAVGARLSLVAAPGQGTRVTVAVERAA